MRLTRQFDNKDIEYHDWFAWRPVDVRCVYKDTNHNEYEIRWLETVKRARTRYGSWEYAWFEK